ncbi:unnamed protein product [Lactuca saligna]|uniref:Ubiquitin-like protease family profile domain-containing protein n=1 Tax=Lactuca saligna TaxID=75948 RepID=A0AA35ZL36_LACSI|nr:unnamed protein product [Lactuca saligna]
MSDENLKPKRIRMIWRTQKIKVDCGVFTMRHMETYMGEKDGKWNSRFGKENYAQKVTLDFLRCKYAAKLILSETNEVASKILELTKEYNKVEESIRKRERDMAKTMIKQRLESI